MQHSFCNFPDDWALRCNAQWSEAKRSFAAQRAPRRVEVRAEDQLLVCDIGGRTRSWLMVSSAEVPGGTRLYFGSAVVPVKNASTGKSEKCFVFKALLSFHSLYSRVLLSAAARRLS